MISAAAYTNAFAGASGTQLRDIDAAAGQLLLQDPPNNGTLGSGVALGISNASTVNGFDVDARNNVGYAALTVGGTVTLYRVDLAATSAAATSLGPVAGGESTVGLALRQPAAATVIGLTTDSRLVSFDPRTPNTLTANVAISGLAAGETVLGIDFRPSDGRLYALTSTGRLYTVDAASGVATLKATLVADTTDATAPFTGLSGNSFSVDFNPAADRLRVLSDTGQSLRINPDATATMPAGATITDGDVNRASGAASVVAAAYSNSFAPTDDDDAVRLRCQQRCAGAPGCRRTTARWSTSAPSASTPAPVQSRSTSPAVATRRMRRSAPERPVRSRSTRCR